ncbi:nucleotidyl transferase AbiEii/AbiGii toxin family protein [candidate division KSB1 bacterium]|nr:nucleotidyl transferase AbiEii/AbiGii toxin family protein [candidate division KSB1 bacterium]
MNEKVESFIAVLKALNAHEVEYILVGGLAVILHGVPRVTEDLDIFVKRDGPNVDKLRRALREVFDDESVDEITYAELAQYPVIRYGTPHNYYIDIMDRIGEAFSYGDLKFEIINSYGLPIRVATKETLIRLKEKTLRMVDQADVVMLKEKLAEKR